MNDTLYVNAALCRNTQRPPIWMMRQAGRYMKEYRAIRERYSFLEMLRLPELAAEITLQPIDAFGMDAAILFSDILVTAEALGASLSFTEGKGPVFSQPIRSGQALALLNGTDIELKLSHIFEEIRLLLPELEKRQVPLIGFAGAPFTVASYLIEGQSSSSLKIVKQLLYSDPAFVHGLLELLANVTVRYLNGQIRAGVHALQIFDTWAGLLSWEDARVFSVNYIADIISRLDNPANIPVTVFCKGSSAFYPMLAGTGAQVIGLEWQADLKRVREEIGPAVALQGNLDPYLLYAPDEVLRDRVNRILSDMAGDSGFIFNLGHGIMPDMSPEKVRLVVETVQSFSVNSSLSVSNRMP